MSNEAKAKARAEELAQTAVKEPDMKECESVLDKYSSQVENSENKQEEKETNVKQEKSTKTTTKSKQSNKK